MFSLTIKNTLYKYRVKNQAFLDGKEPEIKPMERIPLDESDFEKTKKKFTCDLCNKEFKGSQQYEGHINGKKHKQVRLLFL